MRTIYTHSHHDRPQGNSTQGLDGLRRTDFIHGLGVGERPVVCCHYLAVLPSADTDHRNYRSRRGTYSKTK